MKAAYLDTSFLIAILFQEASYKKHERRLKSFDTVLCANLLESETLSTVYREGFKSQAVSKIFESFFWISIPERLSSSLELVFSKSYLRGADAHHLASALWIVGVENTSECHFLSLDKNQLEAAKKLGFKT